MFGLGQRQNIREGMGWGFLFLFFYHIILCYLFVFKGLFGRECFQGKAIINNNFKEPLTSLSTGSNL